MRWDNLFDDLESQLELELASDELDLVAEEERLRLGRLTLRERLVALTSAPGDQAELQLELRSDERIALRITATGRDWVAGDLLPEHGARRAAIVPLDAIAGLLPTPAQVAGGLRNDPGPEPTTSLAARLGLTFVLRDLCRRRVPVDVVTLAARHHGTIDRVGRDHLDLAEHEVGTPRRQEAVRRTRIVPTTAIVMVRF
jgi:hypothetical protein